MKNLIRLKIVGLLTLLCVSAFQLPAYSGSGDLAKFEKAKLSFKQGITYFNNMQYLASVEYFRKAISEYPDYYTAREYLARAYRLAGFKNEAITEWEFLANGMSNNALILNKIDMLRFQETAPLAGTGSGEFVLADEYIAAQMRQYRFSHPVDMTIDNEKNTYITSFSTGKLVKMDLNRNGLAVLTPALSSKLYGIDYFDRRLVVSDFGMDLVYIMNTEPKILKTLGSSGNAEGKFHGPQGVSFDPKGNIYVVDSGNSRVQKFDKDGGFILSFGTPGEYEGNFLKPTDCAAARDRVYVTDTGNNRLAVFDDSGNFLKNITLEGSEKLKGISIYHDKLLVSDEKNGLMFYNTESGQGSWFKSWDNGKRSFSRLYSAFIGWDNLLYCLDYNYERMFVFNTLEQRYTNLDVEICLVDLKKYPVVAFYLSVRDRNGKPVYGLKRENFSITEDSAGMSGIYVEYLKNKEPSVSMTLCVDRSKGMREYHGDVPWLSEFILKKMHRNDSLRILMFNKDSWVENDFDWSRRRALKALKTRDYGDGKNIGKALYNAVSSVLPKTNRRGVILITDENVQEDSFAQYTEKNIIEYARSHFIPIYIISFKEKNKILERIARSTGGDIYSTRQVDDLREIYDRIKNSEEYRYALVYYTYKMPNLKGWWSDVKLEVKLNGMKGIEWGGYFAP